MEGPLTIHVCGFAWTFIRVSMWNLGCIFPVFRTETLKDPMEQSKEGNYGCKDEASLMMMNPIGSSGGSRPDEVPGEIDRPEEQQQCRRTARPKVVMVRK